MTTDASGRTWEQFADELFADEYCAECSGDAEHHEPWLVAGNWFAHCTLDMEHSITLADLIEQAEGLSSEHGENPEYDRALVELVIRCTPGATHDDDTERFRRLIGVQTR